MAARRNQPEQTPPDLPPEKSHPLLKGQLAKLPNMRGLSYEKAEADEDEWYQFTSKLIDRSFGSGSSNGRHFRSARSAGDHFISLYGTGVNHAQNQQNFQARLQAYETTLKSCLAELEIDLPEAEIKGVYQPGEEYELYSDVSACLGLAQKEIFVIDPYLNTEIFDVYARAIPRTVRFRLLSANVPVDVQALAQKYASGGNLSFRNSASIHDRVLFADNRVWVCGQSFKDAAKKKPTYIVEHDEALMRPGYEEIWTKAAVII